MKKTLSILASIIITLISAQAFAKSASNVCGSDSLHCAYVTGLSSDSSDGRIIKLVDKNGYFETGCLTNNFITTDIDTDSAPFEVGSYQDKYYICNDPAGNDCKFVGNDNYTVSQDGDTYIAEPAEYKVDLSSLQSSFAKCDTTKLKSFQRVH